MLIQSGVTNDNLDNGQTDLPRPWPLPNTTSPRSKALPSTDRPIAPIHHARHHLQSLWMTSRASPAVRWTHRLGCDAPATQMSTQPPKSRSSDRLTPSGQCRLAQRQSMWQFIQPGHIGNQRAQMSRFPPPSMEPILPTRHAKRADQCGHAAPKTPNETDASGEPFPSLRRRSITPRTRMAPEIRPNPQFTSPSPCSTAQLWPVR